MSTIGSLELCINLVLNLLIRVIYCFPTIISIACHLLLSEITELSDRTIRPGVTDVFETWCSLVGFWIQIYFGNP